MMRRTRGGGRGGSGGGGHNPSHGNGGGGRGPRSGGGHHGSGVPSRHHVYDSNGPDVRIRGNAYQVCEKYQALARDAHAAGDRVKAENYLQHSEHYYRIILAIQEATGEIYRARPTEEGTPEGAEAMVVTSDPAAQPQPVLDPSQQPQPDTSSPAA